jgi:peptidoglycan/LPS O-acetylase OafA/YrhL
MSKRISYLDGHRGMAILLVILFHAYTRWPALVPYGNRFAQFPIFEYGWMGVELFFLISGFVILMTLEKCTNIQSFLYRRWLRLFPAILISTILIFGSAGFFWERPSGVPKWESLIPSLTLIDPSWWEYVTKRPIGFFEGAFWSLYVEVKFYVFSALIYYWKGRKPLFIFLTSAFALSVIILLVADKGTGSPVLRYLSIAVKELSFAHFGWFTSGAAFYVYCQSRLRVWLGFAVATAIVSSMVIGGLQFAPVMAALLILLLFAGPILVPTLQKPLNSRILQFYGFISYPLYLIHENMMIAIIVKLGNKVNPAFFFFLPAVPIVLLSGVAYLLAKYVEPYVKAVLSRGIQLNIG